MWHGFVSISEFSRSFVSLLLVLFLGLPKFVTSNNNNNNDSTTNDNTSSGNGGDSTNVANIERRPQKDLSLVPPAAYNFGIGEYVFEGKQRYMKERRCSSTTLILLLLLLLL